MLCFAALIRAGLRIYFEQEHMVPSSEILDGVYDSYIRGFARQIKDIEAPVLIRFGHEMNFKRYHGDESDSTFFLAWSMSSSCRICSSDSESRAFL